ncbi:TlpA disulfide reductase family protein [Arenibacter sp. M-2]|uniref:TlpA disulfide reductase family protein n=1 Tax=Arenibacter sp. M-2 TaxID=3053612 RepID=UPI002570BF32|nr:TlpA disulfide reductase family protein [Arenibacter sp. M-2]MDL5513759.1 TlpA disulfide reductase family protein [Arenibacter sp. M-2]|tara:strand:- start:7372 stop:8502 length:1131 start_codon:yes stop_codon:yes gene_type:complete
MKTLVYIFIGLLSFQATAQKDNFKIIGNFDNIKEADSIFICNVDKKNLVPFSKAKVKRGKFTLTGYVPYEHGYYTMVTTQGKDTVYGRLFVEKGTIKYTGLFTKYPVFDVKGSKYAHKIFAGHKDPKYLRLREEVMAIEASETTDEEKIELQKLQQELGSYMNNVDKDWFDKSHSSYQLYSLYEIDPKTDFDNFEKKVKFFQANYPDHPETMGMGFAYEYYKKNKEEQEAGIFKKSRVGTQFMEVTAVDVEGNTHRLSEILKNNKLVLLDFWASWCGPCRAEFPHLRIAYDEYKDKGFEIYAVSLDESQKKWLTALEQEKTSWINTVDLEAWKSQSVKDYEITGIPYNILVNAKGEILGESLRGKDLEDFLVKHLN